MCGAIPQYLSLGLIIEEGLKISEFWDILQAIRNACDEVGVKVVTGDTKVVERGKADKLFINTTGIGTIHPRAAIKPENVASGDVVLVSGYLAVHGITIMSLREGLTFGTSLTSDTKPLNHAVSSLLDKFGYDIHLIRDATRGGVATVLNEISKQTGFGIEIEEAALPVPEEVQGACEMLGLDPLYVANEGVFCALVGQDAAEELLSHLQMLPGGEDSTIIGQIVDDHPGKVVLKNEIGARRVINMLSGDQLPRIC
jgi:hydrogenase expression/formation protein HypE